MPAALLDWFGAGAADLEEQFRAAEPGEPVWTWSPDHSVGFWQRMQAIEAAVHRWDAENAVGTARPLDAALAADAVGQTFEFMAPMRRAVAKAPPGQGERFLFRRTDGPEAWAVQFDGDAIRLGAPGDQHDIQISATASDLALFLWQRKVAGLARGAGRHVPAERLLRPGATALGQGPNDPGRRDVGPLRCRRRAARLKKWISRKWRR